MSRIPGGPRLLGQQHIQGNVCSGELPLESFILAETTKFLALPKAKNLPSDKTPLLSVGTDRSRRLLKISFVEGDHRFHHLHRGVIALGRERQRENE